MSSSGIQIFNYYKKLNAYLHGAPNDPGDFRIKNSRTHSYSNEVTVTQAIPEDYQWLYRNLDVFVEQYPSLIQNVIVQGSYGDFTNNNYSDLDIVLYLKQAVVENHQKRKQLRKIIQRKMMSFIYSIDPLQHHGVFLLWPELCDAYVESILPLVVYSNAWSIRRFDTVFRCTAQNLPDRTQPLIQTILSESRSIGGMSNFYYVKRLTSHIMMVPCIYFMDRGTFMHKASAFEPFIEKFRETERLLADVTKIRNCWPKRPWLVKIMGYKSIGYRMFGKFYPSACGILFRSRWIKRRLHRLEFNALSKVGF